MESARLSSSAKPAAVRWWPRAIALTTRANFSKSACLCRQERDSFEEGDHVLEQLGAVLHHKHLNTIPHAIRSNAPALEPLLDQSKHLSSVAILSDMELRY
jgi:hypothetical protein